MKQPAKAVIFILWISIASMLLTRLWIIHPEIFLEFPKPFSEYLAVLYGVRGAEDIADLEILVGLSMSAPIVSVITYLAFFVWRGFRRKAR